VDYARDEEAKRKDQVQPELQADTNGKKCCKWWNEDRNNDTDDIHEKAF